MNPVYVSAGTVLLTMLGGVLLYGLLRGVRRLLRVLPLNRRQQRRVQRVLPVVEGFVAVAYIASTVPLVFDRQPAYAALMLVIIAVVLVAVGFNELRDMVSGLVLRSGDALRVGDRIGLDGVQGRVRRVGLRVVEFETDAGEAILVPLRKAAGAVITREPSDQVLERHVMVLDAAAIAPGLSATDLERLVREAAWSCHWHAVSRRPRTSRLDGGGCEIVLFLLDARRSARVEERIRTAIGPQRPADAP